MSPHKATPSAEQSYIASAVSDAHSKFLASNPSSAKAHNGALDHMPGGNTRTVLYTQPFPLSIKSGTGNTLTSADGRTYIDFLGEYSAGLFGHSHPIIADAIATALKSGWNFGGETLYEKELARKITARFSDGGMELVRFTNSGTEANTMAIAAAIAWTGGRKKVLVFSNSYHGSTFIFPMAMCRWAHSKSSGPPPSMTLNMPHDFVVAPFNNIAETKAIVDDLPKDSLAAIIIEPVQGSGGCRPVIPDFMAYLRETATKLGALLIIDEVMTSRLGLSGCLATLGLKADLMTLGKWLGGGMTFGAFGGRRDIMAMFDPARGSKGLLHPGTFNNNVLSMSAGIASIDIYNEQKVEELNARGNRMKEGITRILFETGLYPQEQAQYLKDVREVDSFETGTRIFTGNDEIVPLPKMLISSRGSMLNVRFTGSDAELWHNLYYHCMMEKGIYLASRGYTPLNLEITDENVDLFVDAVKEFVTLHLGELKS
jgi:glutamate-1-semialdehyde 2,1-aminomutase